MWLKLICMKTIQLHLNMFLKIICVSINIAIISIISINIFNNLFSKMKRLDPFKDDKQENPAKEEGRKQPEDNQDT